MANNLSVYNVATNQTVTISGNITAHNTTYDVADGTTLSLDGAISGNGGLTKNGNGTLELNATNSYTGDTVVNFGTLSANASGAMGNTGNITVHGGSLLVMMASGAVGNATQKIKVEGGSLLMAASNAVGNSTGIELAGGNMTFSGDVTNSIGALTLSANSVLNLGAGRVVVYFSNLVMGNHTLAVHNWTGTTLWNGGTGNNTDQIYFNRALTSSELERISFYSDFGNDFLGTGFQLGLGSGFQYEVIPVPEPKTWATAALLLIGGTLWLLRGRKRHLKAPRSPRQVKSPPTPCTSPPSAGLFG